MRIPAAQKPAVAMLMSGQLGSEEFSSSASQPLGGSSRRAGSQASTPSSRANGSERSQASATSAPLSSSTRVSPSLPGNVGGGLDAHPAPVDGGDGTDEIMQLQAQLSARHRDDATHGDASQMQNPLADAAEPPGSGRSSEVGATTPAEATNVAPGSLDSNGDEGIGRGHTSLCGDSLPTENETDQLAQRDAPNLGVDDPSLARNASAQSTHLLLGFGVGGASTDSLLQLPGDDNPSTLQPAPPPQSPAHGAGAAGVDGLVEFEPVGDDATVGTPHCETKQQEQVASVVRADDGESVVLPPQAAIADALPGAVMVADSQGTIVYTNDHFTRLLGYSREAAIGSSLALFVPSDSLKSLQNMIRRLIVTGSAGKRGTDGKGTQIDVLSNMGEAVPVLLNVNRMSHNNRYWVVGDMQDLRHHVQGGADVEEVRWCYLACILVWG